MASIDRKARTALPSRLRVQHGQGGRALRVEVLYGGRGITAGVFTALDGTGTVFSTEGQSGMC